MPPEAARKCPACSRPFVLHTEDARRACRVAYHANLHDDDFPDQPRLEGVDQ